MRRLPGDPAPRPGQGAARRGLSWPLLAGLCLVGLLALLRTGDRPRTEPEPDPTTTSSTAPAELPSLGWAVLGPAGRALRITNVHDLQRDRTVVQLRRVDGSTARGSMFQDEDVREGRTVAFVADVRVQGEGRAGIWMTASVRNLGTGGEARPLASSATIDVDPVTAGDWVRRRVTVEVPAGAIVLYGVSLEGGGSVLLDPVEVP